MVRVFALMVIMFAGLAIIGCSSADGLLPNVEREVAGFDDYGLNEVAGIFHGSYFNNYCGREPYNYDAWEPGNDAAYLLANPGADNHWAWPYRSTDLLMKWNHYWPNENGWITNHMWDSYEEDGVTYNWDSFVKIVWVGPAPDPGVDPYAGYRIWNVFTIIQDVYNDPHYGYHGNTPIPGPNGFGAY